MFIPTGLIDSEPALVQVTVWRRISNKLLPEPMMTDTSIAIWRHWSPVDSGDIGQTYMFSFIGILILSK